MSTFKPYPELKISIADPETGEIFVQTAGGVSVFSTIGFRDDAEIQRVQRLVDCWNACRKIHSPAAHIAATDEYVERIEKLRKDACARIVELEAELRTKETSGGEAVSMNTEWNFDTADIPRGRQEPRTRKVKDEIKEYFELVPVKLWLAHPTDGKVYATHWIEATKFSKGRWLGWCEGQEPIAWMLHEKPVHPHASGPAEIAA